MTGQEFRRIRKDVLGVTQAQLAELLDVTPNAVARWEREERGIFGPVERLLRLLAAHPRRVAELERSGRPATGEAGERKPRAGRRRPSGG